MEKALLVCDFCNGDMRVAVNRYPREGVIPGRGGPTKYIDVCATHDRLMQAGMSALYKSIAGKALPRGHGVSSRKHVKKARIKTVIARPNGENWHKIADCLRRTPKITAQEIATKTGINMAVVQENLWRARQLKMVVRHGSRPYRHELSAAPQ